MDYGKGTDRSGSEVWNLRTASDCCRKIPKRPAIWMVRHTVDSNVLTYFWVRPRIWWRLKPCVIQ